VSFTTPINIGMHIHEVTKPPSPEQQRVRQLKQQLDQARLQQKRVKLNQQQSKLNQQRATLVGKQ
jgi:hypothetical protein